MRIHFSWGGTRFVILIWTVAIKIARPRPFRALRRLVEHWMNGEVRARLLTFAENPFLAIIRYIFSGIIANRNEYRLWQESRHNFLVPTLYSFWYLINIQKRGESISQKEFITSHPLKKLLAGKSPAFVNDMTQAENFCRYEGQVSLLDYGSDETFALLSLPQSSGTTALANMAR